MASDDKNVVLITSQLCTIHGWISDLGSCFHICSVREIFDEGSLHLGNTTVLLTDCKKYVNEVDMVTLEMHNVTNCALTGVWYIPDLEII